ncbi:hypothetical protein MGG_16040 [Pyricularia oryzae 70-15]|uniref:Uncharacterized protein n=3 Tax=Pyricularia oryzae TaxID=318829 RepID=G4MNT6_PYRO7|nr:uncharacterized protein MGG_16040 [Pyricularia oryzae 70-15]EHA56302.1 hypothetical protein MGG_16040 [Pyricularia oryzae 70-15]ELQ40772.1 hypothetical protein OOU_Y34scaffold00360g5 [Pyricularia oryzae Y34]
MAKTESQATEVGPSPASATSTASASCPEDVCAPPRGDGQGIYELSRAHRDFY